MDDPNNLENEKNKITMGKSNNASIRENNVDETTKLRKEYTINNDRDNIVFSEPSSINQSFSSGPDFESSENNSIIFDVEFEGKNYKVKLQNNIEKQNFIIYAQDNKTIEHFYYEYIGNLKELQTNYFFFRAYENIKEIFDELCAIMQKKAYEFALENKTELILKLKVILGTKEKEIDFKFHKKNISKEQTINNLIKTVNKYGSELKYILDENKKLKEKIENLHKIISEENLITDETIKKINTSLILNKKYYYLLKKGFEISTGNCNNFKLTLLYKASTHGDNKSSLLSKCKPYKNILIIIKTDSQNVFGLYNESEWSEKNNNKNNFVFSFDKMKIYPGKGGQCNAVINVDKSYIVINGVGGLIDENFMRQCSSYLCQLETNKKIWKNFSKDYELNNGTNKFIAKELEAFKVCFN